MALSVRPGADRDKREAVLHRWYRLQLRGRLPALLAKWEPQVGARPAEVRIKQMKTRWGTCNQAARRIWLNLELAKKPAPCLEYIVVHELVHLIERSHNDRFLELMDGPDASVAHASGRAQPRAARPCGRTGVTEQKPTDPPAALGGRIRLYFRLAVMRIWIAVLGLLGAGAPAWANPELLPPALELGAKDCLFCHAEPAGGKNWNARGHWLLEQKQQRGAPKVSVAWLREYAPVEAPETAAGGRRAAEHSRNPAPRGRSSGPTPMRRRSSAGSLRAGGTPPPAANGRSMPATPGRRSIPRSTASTTKTSAGWSLPGFGTLSTTRATSSPAGKRPTGGCIPTDSRPLR